MLNVNVSPETEQILTVLAAQNGQSVADLASKILEKEIAKNKSITSKVQKVAVDQRHFRMFRPKHCAAFEILP